MDWRTDERKGTWTGHLADRFRTQTADRQQVAARRERVKKRRGSRHQAVRIVSLAYWPAH